MELSPLPALIPGVAVTVEECGVYPESSSLLWSENPSEGGPDPESAQLWSLLNPHPLSSPGTGIPQLFDQLAGIADSLYRAISRFLRHGQTGFVIPDGQSRDEVRNFAWEVQAHCGLLHSLQLASSCLFEAEDSAPAPPEYNLGRIGTYIDCILSLEKKLAAVESATKADASTGSGRTVGQAAQQQIHWPLTREETKTSIQRLSSFQPTLKIVLGAESRNNFLRALTTPNPGLIDTAIFSRPFVDWDLIRKINPSTAHLTSIPNKASDVRPALWSQTLEGQIFQRWDAGDLHRLWLHAEPGCGKSGFASTVIKRLFPKTGNSTAVCFYFADYSDPRWLEPVNVAGGLLSQLITQSKAATDLVRSRVESVPSTESTSEAKAQSATPPFQRDWDSVVSLFQAALAAFETSYIVIDGVDEGGQALTNVIRDLITVLQHPTDPEGRELTLVKILLLSRDTDGIRSMCSELDFTVARLDPGVGDVQEMVRMDNGMILRGYSWPMREKIAAVLTSKQRSFRWTECQIHCLCQLPSDEARLQALESLPSNLEDTYRRIFTSLKGDSRKQTALSTALLWTTFAEDLDMTAPELCQALSVHMSPEACHTGAVDTITEHELETLWSCLGPRMGQTSDSMPGLRSYLSARPHRTVVEYILGGDVASLEASGLLAEKRREARAQLAKAALRFVNFAEFGHGLAELEMVRQLTQQRRQRHPFYAFASQAWIDLLYGDALADDSEKESERLSLEPDEQAEMRKLEYQLFDPQKTPMFTSWLVQCCQQRMPVLFNQHALAKPLLDVMNLVSDDAFTVLHAASSMGLPHICRHLIQVCGMDVNAQCTLGTPLHFALRGHRAFQYNNGNLAEFRWSPSFAVDLPGTVQTLMELGANPKIHVKTHQRLNSLATLALFASAEAEDAGIFDSVVRDASMLNDEFQNYFEAAEFCVSLLEPSTPHLPEKDRLSPPRKAFLNQIYAKILDWTVQITPRPSWRSIHDTGWRYAETLGLDCANVKIKRRIPMDDMAYRTRLETQKSPRPQLVKHLMQDPRWDANIVLKGPGDDDDDDERGQTILHLAAELLEANIMELLLEHGGADPSIRDAKGRTPLLLCEAPNELKVLKKYGADFAAQDNEGRTIWHVAAANNDKELLEALLEVDKDGAVASLGLQSKAGRTPVAEAFHYLTELIDHGTYQTLEFKGPKAALLLLKNVPHGESAYLQSDIPLFHLAAEWGVTELVTRLAELGVAEDIASVYQGASPFHFLNFNTTKEHILALRAALDGAKDIPLQREDGKTAAETIFLTIRFDDGDDDNAHPSHWKKLDTTAYEELLTDEVLESKDKDGHGLWQRFCEGVILHYCKHTHFWPLAPDSLVPAVQCLVDKRALARHEELTEESGIGILARTVWNNAELIPPWLMKIYLIVIADTKHFDKIKADESVVLSLQWAVGSDISERPELIKGFLDRGVSLHSVARGLSTLDALCHPACGKCDLKTFTELVKKLKPEEINKMRVFGQTALHLLCTEPDNLNGPHGPRIITQRHEKFRALVKAGADPNIRTAEGMPTIVLAIIRNEAELARLLILEFKVDLLQRTDEGLDAALAAASRGMYNILQSIRTAAGDSFPWKNGYSMTISMRDRDRKSVVHRCNGVHLSCMNGHAESLRFYLHHGYIDANEPTNENGLRPLHFAAMGGSTACIRLLIEHGADVKVQADDGCTALHKAVAGRNPEAVKALLALGCPPDVADRDGLTPLIEAVRVNAPQCADLLIKAGMNGINDATVTSERRTRLLSEALEVAIRHFDLDMCRTVLQVHGCPVDAIMPSCKGCTALMAAVRHCKPDLVRLFLDNGASVFVGQCKKHYHFGYNTVNEACLSKTRLECLTPVLDAALRLHKNWFPATMTPIHCAAERNNIEALEKVLAHVAANVEAYSSWMSEYYDLDTTLPPASPLAQDDLHAVTRRLINWRIELPNLNTPYYNGSTALHMAVSNRSSLDVVRMLLTNGADPDAHDFTGSTPLHMAVVEGIPEAATLLLAEAGANVDMPDYEGATPLAKAAEMGRLDFVKLLVEHGASVRSLTRGGLAILRASVTLGGEPEVFDYLVREHGLDPYARDPASGMSVLHEALRCSAFVSYVLNGNWDLLRIAEEPDVPRSLLGLMVGDCEDVAILPRLLRRIPAPLRPKFLDVYPSARSSSTTSSGSTSTGSSRNVLIEPGSGGQGSCSPLCEAAWRGFDLTVAVLLRFGADVEMEGSWLGTPLMAAAAYGRLKVVRVLVRAGARIAYTNAAGQTRSAVALAAKFPEIVRWLLVGRYRQRLLSGEPFWRRTETGQEQEQQRDNDNVRPWSGIVVKRYLMTGSVKDHRQISDESMFDFLVRMEGVRQAIAGRVIVPYTGDTEVKEPRKLRRTLSVGNRKPKP